MNFPFTKQHDSMQCGIACLSMVCKYYGREYSLESLSQICHATTEGVSLFGISEAAYSLGLHSISGMVSIEELSNAPLPCILHWNQNHFVVLYKIKNRNRFYIADPGKGLITCSSKEFKESWACMNENEVLRGIAMFIEPTPVFYEKKNNSEPLVRSFNFLLGYLKQYRKYFGKILFGLLIGCVIQLILPFLTQLIVDQGIKNQNIGFVWLILVGQFVLTVSRTVIDFMRQWILLRISMKINLSLISDFFIKLLKLPMSFFDTKLMGDLMQRMNDHSRVERFLTNQTLKVLFSVISFMVFSFVLLFYNSIIFSVFITGSILYGVWIMLFLGKRKVLDYELFGKQAENNSKTIQFLTAMQEIKLQNCEQRRRVEWEDVQRDLFKIQLKSLKLQQTQDAGSVFINELKNIVITVMAATAVIQGEMTLGMMLAVQYIIGQLNSPIDQLMSFFYALQDVKISLERINEIHIMKNEEGAERVNNVFINESRSMKFEDVDFKYDLHSPTLTLSGIDCNIPQGKVTAIVGASGSGKTTMIKLLLGYYPVPKGTITIGKMDINTVNLKWWRNQCGVVMQDGVIFSESIERNIAVGDEEVDKDCLNNAAKIANIYDYIQSLPLKYNTKIGKDGVGLSQGQKQRVLIARAVYKNPDYIFLDEATNSLDANNEKTIVENLNNFYKGRTVVVVAHRLSTVKNADQIIVLNEGKVVEIGNHGSLSKKKGIYYNLVKNQLELGQ